MPAIPYVLPHKGECFLPWLKNGRILPLCNICLFNLLSLASKEQASKVFQSLTERWSRRRQVLAFPRCNEVHWPFQLFDRAYFQHSRGIGFCQFRDLIGWEVKLLGTFQFLMRRERRRLSFKSFEFSINPTASTVNTDVTACSKRLVDMRAESFACCSIPSQSHLIRIDYFCSSPLQYWD